MYLSEPYHPIPTWVKKVHTGKPDLPCMKLGSRKERKGHAEHATYIISLESFILNTGEPERDVKESGK